VYIVKKALFLAMVMLTGFLLSGSAVIAVGSADIGGKPANPRDENPRSQSIFVYELEPGDKINDAVEVVNNSDEEKTILVYAVDSQVASDGAFACAQKVDSSVSVGTWVTLAKNKVTLAAQTTEDVPFTLTVPDTASAGEQNGCIVIQDSQQTPSPQGNGVTLSFRSAIRVAVTVPGEITKDLDFTGPVVIKVDRDIIHLSVGLKNNGNVSLDTEVSTNIKNIAGGTVSSAGGVFPVLAKSQAVFNFEVKKPFWGGWHSVGATATYGSDLAQSLGENGNKKTIKSLNKTIFIAPEPIALAIEILVLATLITTGALLVSRKKRYKKLLSQATNYKVKHSESLQIIAKKHGVSWRTIAKINKLKAPYHIEPGQELKIPNKNTRGSGHAKRFKRH
jgi:LysM repeat protein